ncbi:MCE family protein [Gordonia crocea]|uniref:Mce family protein Mce3C n=1 Tax=Gordonia crocea TaxID=589162 RepID=A0A7I9V1J1_9ACTN|nr:MCE family protein [Gordonia crocea]GED99052.1 Mce family protein Mce3C [Gordonia crocea]
MSEPIDTHRAGSNAADVERDAARGQRSRAATGVIGFVVTALVVLTALQMNSLPFLSPVSTYDAFFDDAGGLVPGDVVSVAGVNVGSVENIRLARTADGTKAAVRFRLADSIKLGVDTQAAIKTETVLGRRNLTLIPHGPGRIKPGGEIANENTVAPYSLTDALDNATGTIEETDTAALRTAMDTLSRTFSATPASVRAAVDGISRLSTAIADRDKSLRELLGRANRVSAVVGDRSDQVNRLLLSANALLGELQNRANALEQIITGARDVTTQIRGFIAENNAQLAPVLGKLDRVMQILVDKKADLVKAIDRLGPYANLLGEAVASGPYFSSLVGVPTFGDYTAVFMKALQRKYPEIFQAFWYTGGNFDPTRYSIAPEYNPNKPKSPAPKIRYPSSRRGR